MTLKRLLALAFALIAVTPAHAQSVLQLRPGAYDSDAQAYFNALAGNSCTAPSVAYMQAISNFVVVEKAAGDWGNQDYRYVIITTDSCTASINLAQPSLYKATIAGTCVLSVASGLVGNTTDCRLDPNVTDTNLKRFSQNNSHILICAGNSGGSNVVGNIGTAKTRISTTSNKATRLNAAADVTDTGGGLAGCHYADRSSSSTITTGKNGVVQSNAVASTSATPGGTDIALCETNGVFCSNSSHFYYYEIGQPIPDEATHYTNLHNLMVALGAVGAP